MHFLALCTAGLKSYKKLSAHLFEVRSRITLASLHRLCVLLWIMSLSVYVCVVRCLPFLFSHTMVFIARAREIRPVLLVFIRRVLSVFLPGCSSLSLSSPLNYYVCAHSGVTLNPGFNLLSDRWHRRHVCWSDIWQALTLWVGKYNYSNEIKIKKGLFTYVLFKQALFTLIDSKLFWSNLVNTELWCVVSFDDSSFSSTSICSTHIPVALCLLCLYTHSVIDCYYGPTCCSLDV